MGQPFNASEVGRLINLMPVGLKEAALDSPTARASIQHFHEQVELFERWLEDYHKSANRLLVESVTLENVLSNFTSHALLPQSITETMLDHDYSVLAVKKYNEGAKDYWMSMVAVVKKLNVLVCEPIKQFQANEIKTFKDAKKTVDSSQKAYDTIQGRYAAQAKTTEPSSLREDAFQLHEARTRYLKAIMDFFTMAPQLRFAIDKLVSHLFYDQWKEMKQARENTANTFHKSLQDMERVKGWTREMEDSERIFKKELMTARKQLEDSAELASRPSRDIDDYSNYTVAHLHGRAGSQGGLSLDRALMQSGERQGWLFLRTWVRKPTRVLWVKRWAFIRNGVFGWLVQGQRPGTVEESERIGVLLCSVRPLPHEERRFCFELKTTKNTIGLQAETQSDLAAWLRVFDIAKSKAIDDPSSSEALTPGLSATEPAFSITAPPVPEFGTAILASTEPETAGENLMLDRSGAIANISAEQPKDTELRRQTVAPHNGGFDDGSKDHASRIMSKLDLHRRTPTIPQVSSPTSPNSGGIASLIASSHGSMPVGPSLPMVQTEFSAPNKKSTFTLALRDMPPSTLAPSTLANIPTPTSWSKTAVAIAGERGINGSRTNKNGIPNSILANTWGTCNGSYVHRLEKHEMVSVPDNRLQPSPMLTSDPRLDEREGSLINTMDLKLSRAANRSRTPSPGLDRRQTFVVMNDAPSMKPLKLPEYPPIYPLQLKTQDAQFRLLFPNVHLGERLVLVFRSTWNPNGQQEFPGRVYATPTNMYFYSNHLGLVLTSAVSLSSIEEVTAAPGRDCDFLFLHLKEPSKNGATRITIKIFLEPLRLLQNRLNYLTQIASAEERLPLEEVVRVLLRLETEVDERTPSLDSWEDLSVPTPNNQSRSRSRANTVDLKAPLRVDRSLWSGTAQTDKVQKFKLPAHPVKYVPPGFPNVAVEKQYDVSPKALFHVMFGDKSLLWQLLQHERQAKDLKQGPWTSLHEGRLYRDFEFSIPNSNMFGQETWSTVKDYQLIDVNNDHLCYVVTDKRTPWHLPYRERYRLVSKIVITHAAKSRCKLAVYTKVEWLSEPWILKRAIESQAMNDLNLDAEDLADLVSDQVRKLGAHSRTKKAVSIFGLIGQSTDVTQLEIDASAVKIESRRSAQRQTVSSMLSQTAASMAQSAIGTILGAIVDVAKWLGKTFKANHVMLLALSFSILYNSWFVTRDAASWWQQRNTIKFLKRMGIGPDSVMSKAVYIDDIQEVMSAQGTLPDLGSSTCFRVFTGDDVSYDMNTNAHGFVMQDTRQQLALYRHDILVALRVVNSVEEQLMRSEWERWLISEHKKCQDIQPLIKGINHEGNTTLDFDELKRWYESYCVSCGNEYAKITNL